MNLEKRGIHFWLLYHVNDFILAATAIA